MDITPPTYRRALQIAAAVTALTLLLTVWLTPTRDANAQTEPTDATTSVDASEIASEQPATSEDEPSDATGADDVTGDRDDDATGGGDGGTAGDDEGGLTPADGAAGDAFALAAVTDGLDDDLVLEAARVRTRTLGSDDHVIFEFSDMVRDVAATDGFVLRGYAADAAVASTSAQVMRADATMVLATFPDGVAVDQFTVAQVRAGAVIDSDDDGNLPGHLRLRGSDVDTGEGRTTNPDLTGVATDVDLDLVEYSFDEDLDADAAPDPAAFGYYTASGAVVEGSEVIELDDDRVVIGFDGDVDDAARHVVRADAVRNVRGGGNPPGVIDGDTARPMLASLELVGDGDAQIDFAFDEAITDIDADAFAVYDLAGNRYDGSSSSRVDNETVRVLFDDLSDAGDGAVLAVVEEDAVAALADGELGNALSSSVLGASDATPGRTTGPDLVGARVDDDTGEVRFSFDEDIDGDARAGDFLLATTDRQVVPAERVIEVEDRVVVVDFPRSDARAAAAAIVEPGSVVDAADEPTPGGVISSLDSDGAES